jgi:hypothetical protein
VAGLDGQEGVGRVRKGDRSGGTGSKELPDKGTRGGGITTTMAPSMHARAERGWPLLLMLGPR